MEFEHIPHVDVAHAKVIKFRMRFLSFSHDASATDSHSVTVHTIVIHKLQDHSTSSERFKLAHDSQYTTTGDHRPAALCSSLQVRSGRGSTRAAAQRACREEEQRQPTRRT